MGSGAGAAATSPSLGTAAGVGVVPGLSGVRKKLGAIGRGSQHSLSGEDGALGGGAQPPMARRAVDAEGARGGFVLRSKSDDVPPHRRRSLVERSGMKTFVQGLKLKKQRSTGDLDRKGVTSIRSTGSTTSWMSSESGYTGASVVSEGSNQSFVLEVTRNLLPFFFSVVHKVAVLLSCRRSSPFFLFLSVGFLQLLSAILLLWSSLCFCILAVAVTKAISILLFT